MEMDAATGDPLLTSILQTRDPYVYPTTNVEPSKYNNGAYNSPVATNYPPRSPVSHAHPRPSSITLSPTMAKIVSPTMRHNGIGMAGPSIKEEPVTVAVSE